jgi:hypothetical protein
MSSSHVYSEFYLVFALRLAALCSSNTRKSRYNVAANNVNLDTTLTISFDKKKFNEICADSD